MSHCFISYSNTDGLDFTTKLVNELEGVYPFIKVWFDKRDMTSSESDWDDQISSAVRSSKCLLFIMSVDSTAQSSNCKEEWTWALKYKKPVICIQIDKKAEDQFRLNSRQKIDFTSNFGMGMAQLRRSIARLDTQEGFLDELKHRVADASRDLRRAKDEDKTLIQSEIDEINAEIKANELIKKDPEKAKKQTRKNINAGLERDREPINPAGGKAPSKFINPRPGSIPDYFEGRLNETEEIADFLRNDFQRIMIINGRAGSGKTVLTCRVLLHLENGKFPNELGEFKIGGIVYLSEISNYKVNVANIFSGLLQLIEPQKASKIEALYKEAKVPVDEKIRTLLAELPAEPVILLLDNFEDLLISDDASISDQELQLALITILKADSHNLKVLITTRELPRQFNMIETARQFIKHLDEGLPYPDAENMLRKMDKDGHVGFRDATEELLGRVRAATLGYPRALEAIYFILRVDRYSDVEELLIDGIPETVVQKFVGEAFSRLDSTKQKIIQILAIYNRPVSSAAVDFALQFHVPGINSAPILERLVSMHFVRREVKRYFLHPADQDYALSRMPKGESDKRIGQGARARTWDQHSLTLRAADYFVEVRKPRAEWKKLDDLAAQLAEFELRCEAGDYDTATNILLEIDFDYLFLWGHYRIVIDTHEKLQGRITDKWLEGRSTDILGSAHSSIGQAAKAIFYYDQALKISKENKYREGEGASLGNLGNAYAELGDLEKSLKFYEQALVISRETNDRKSEGTDLGNLGSRYFDLGDMQKAVKFHEQALFIAREVGDKQGEENNLICLGMSYSNIGEYGNSIEFYQQALTIIEEIGDRRNKAYAISNLGSAYFNIDKIEIAISYFKEAIEVSDGIPLSIIQNNSRCGLAETYVFQKDLVNARAAIEAALQYDVPMYNHSGTALHGIIALRQGEKETAQEAFTKSIAQADEILAKTPDYYSALYAKGLSICGLILAGRGDPSMPIKTNDGKTVPPDKDTVSAGRVPYGHDIAPTVDDAIETFQKARKIAPHAGVVKSVLRLFDELVKCDNEGILKDVRNAVEGKE